MLREIRPAIVLLLVLTAITGLAYPLAMTAIAGALFPARAQGSLIEKDGKVVGSALIGQPFDDPMYFWGRPSATGPYRYHAGSSSGSNLGPLNPALESAVKERVAALNVVRNVPLRSVDSRRIMEALRLLSMVHEPLAHEDRGLMVQVKALVDALVGEPVQSAEKPNRRVRTPVVRDHAKSLTVVGRKSA